MDLKYLTTNSLSKRSLFKELLKRLSEIFKKKRLLDNFPNADKAFKDFLFVTRRRLDIKEMNDTVIH